MNRSFLIVALVTNILVGGSVYLLAQVDSFPNSRSTVVNGPANDATAVTESASAFVDMSRGLYVGTGGDMAITTRGGTNVTFKNVADGTVIPVRASHLLTASTVADVVNLHD